MIAFFMGAVSPQVATPCHLLGYNPMMGRCLLGLALLASACSAKLADLPGETIDDANTGIDSNTSTDDAALPDAFVLGAWGAATKVTGASSPAVAEDDPTLSSTALEMVFAVLGANGKDLYYASRASTTAGWSTPVPLALNLTTSTEETPRFTADDLTLYFASDRVPANGLDIYRITRPTVGGPWSAPALVAGPNTVANEKWLAPCTGGRYLVILGGDIAQGTLGGGAPTVVASLSAAAPASETGTFLTPDCLTTYFASTRSGPNRIYMSTRANVTDPWPAPTLVNDFIAIGGNQEDPWVSPDQRTFLLASDVSGTKDVYLSVR